MVAGPQVLVDDDAALQAELEPAVLRQLFLGRRGTVGIPIFPQDIAYRSVLRISLFFYSPHVPRILPSEVFYGSVVFVVPNKRAGVDGEEGGVVDDDAALQAQLEPAVFGQLFSGGRAF